MRTVLFLLLGLFVLQTAQARLPKAKPPKALKKFAKAFEKASKLGTYSDLMPFFDDAYVKEQHDTMLEGRTEQFIREFLSGTLKDSDAFYSPKDITEIKSVKVSIGIPDKDGSWSATLLIINWKGKRYQRDTLIKPREWTSKSPHAFGFVGAFG